jgi:hypothetical protein
MNDRQSALAFYIDDQVPPVARLAGKTFRLDGPLEQNR